LIATTAKQEGKKLLHKCVTLHFASVILFSTSAFENKAHNSTGFMSPSQHGHKAAFADQVTQMNASWGE
jgi:hypothetical protein